jgi:hypothetical protein
LARFFAVGFIVRPDFVFVNCGIPAAVAASSAGGGRGGAIGAGGTTSEGVGGRDFETSRIFVPPAEEGVARPGEVASGKVVPGVVADGVAPLKDGALLGILRVILLFGAAGAAGSDILATALGTGDGE